MKIVLVLFIFLVQFAVANQTYTTARGFEFIQVNDPGFGMAWKAPDGNFWSAYQGKFPNEGTSIHSDPNSNDDEVIDSVAVKVCEAIGGKLPSMNDYRKLREYFKNSPDYVSIFPGEGMFYWTSTTQNKSPRYMRIRPYLDAFGDLANSRKLYGVQCVKMAPL